MNSRDLCIGNYVQDSYGRIGRVLFIREQSIRYKCGNSDINVNIAEISPIALNEWTLLKMGFEDFQGVFYYNIDNPMSFYVGLFGNMPSLYLVVQGEEHYLGHVQYVHQIQNLIYILTQKDLEINGDLKEGDLDFSSMRIGGER